MDAATVSAPQTSRKGLTEARVNCFWTQGFPPIGKLLEDDEIEQI